MVLLRLEIPSSMCAELRTVAASNNRDHPTRSLSPSPFTSTINCSPGVLVRALSEVTHQDHSIGITLLLLVRATYIMVLFFTHIPFVVNHTINATPPERLQQYTNKLVWMQTLRYVCLHIYLFKLLQFLNHYSVTVFIIKNKCSCLYLLDNNNLI